MDGTQTFEDLAGVVEHELFPDVDLALRRGRHVDRDDAAWYGFLSDAQPHLERFYRRYGAELVQRTDGFFFLLPSGDKLGKRHLSPNEMLVGQGLTLLYLDPSTVEQGGITTRDQLLSQLSASMGTEHLMAAFNGAKKKRIDERVAQEMVRKSVSEAIRRLASLGFVELLPEDRIRLRASLMRFAEPVRGSGADVEALNKLVASGEVALQSDDDVASDEIADTETREASSPDAAPTPDWNESEEWGRSFDAETTTDDSADVPTSLDDLPEPGVVAEPSEDENEPNGEGEPSEDENESNGEGEPSEDENEPNGEGEP